MTPEEELRGLQLGQCAICQASAEHHRRLEEAGEIHHAYSRAGELVHSTGPEKKPKVLATPDLILRMALVDKGIITTEDLLRAEMKLREPTISSGSGPGHPGDSSDR